MNEQKDLRGSFEEIRKNLQNFIDLSLVENETSWMDWVSKISRKIDVKCWEKKQCGNEQCPAYKHSCGRCWIIAGTMLPGEVQCNFAKKYQSCKNCEVYQEAVYKNPVVEMEEYIIVLVHSLRSKQQELNLVANTDFLTKLHNRRYMDTYLQHEIMRMKRDNTSRVLMIIDVNNFKKINDTCGHKVGDDVLVECAKIIKKATRTHELVSRYGGDEFLILLHINADHALAVNAFIQRIEGLVDERNSRVSNEGPAISFSYGHTVVYSDTEISHALTEADRNMYLDKEARKRAG